MPLSADQQQIVNLISNHGQEIILFDYSLGGAFDTMEVWVDVYHYGEFVDTFTNLHILGGTESALDDGQLAIMINNVNRSEYSWTISSGGATAWGHSWAAEADNMASAHGPINDAVPITDGEVILLYIARFTTGSSINTFGDRQHYLLNPEVLKDFTYAHLIKARFTTN